MSARWGLVRVVIKSGLGCAVLAAVLTGCSSSPPPAEEAVKSELKQLDEMRERERSNK